MADTKKVQYELQAEATGRITFLIMADSEEDARRKFEEWEGDDPDIEERPIDGVNVEDVISVTLA